MNNDGAANDQFQIHDSMTYSMPESAISGDINFVRFKSMATSYGPTQSLEINVSSTNEYLDLERSYLTYTITETGVTNTNGSVLSSVGGSVIFSEVYDTLSGVQLPTMRNWNVFNAIKLGTDNATRKTITSQCEFYTGTTTGTTVTTGTGINIVTRIPTTLSSANKSIPLCVLSGGWRLNATLSPYNQVFQKNLSGNSYTITNVELVGCLVKAPDTYLAQIKQGLASGKVMNLPLSLTKNISSSLTATTPQTVKIQTGFLSSLDSLTFTYRKAADIGTGTATTAHDALWTSTSNLTSYYLTLNSMRFPRNKEIYIANGENLYQLLASFNTGINTISAPNSSFNDFLHYSFKSNEYFNSGVPIQDGYLEWQSSWSSSPTAGDVLDSFISYSALLKINADTVSLLV